MELLERGVGLLKPMVGVPKHLGLDEKSIRKGSRFAAIVTDIQAGAVIEVAEGRTKESVYRSLGSYSLNDLAEAVAVAVDMSQTYVSGPVCTPCVVRPLAIVAFG